MIQFDLQRYWVRRRMRRRVWKPSQRKLHLGCGRRKIDGWWNVDVQGGDERVDLAAGRLPWEDGAFDVIVSQHVIEHLELQSELLPLLSELHRVLSPHGEIWLSCPDMERACRDYIESAGDGLVRDRQSRYPSFSMCGVPTQHFINVLFQQSGEHRNLFDIGLLTWAVETSGFSECVRVDESALQQRFPEFPLRNDGFQSLYVRAAHSPSSALLSESKAA
jgi:predicted SAM-dependent methyltransferase